MTRRILSTPTFERAIKKLHARDKKALDGAIGELIALPSAGIAKKGDLAGVLVHKFKLNKQEILLSYQLPPGQLVLLSLGSHENFYRDLKHLVR
jgi:mRNA interferase RelE/StbE